MKRIKHITDITSRPAFALWIFTLVLLLWSWPILSAPTHLLIYLFGTWLLLIVCIIIATLERKQ